MDRLGRKTAVLAVAIAVVAGLTHAPADTVASGPEYPAPGLNSWVGVGDMTRAGGATWSYADFDMSLFLNLWWGVWGAEGVNLAFDGTVDEPGETLEFSIGDSDLPAGIAVYYGSSDMLLFNGPVVLPTRFTITSSSPLDFEAAAGVEGPGALVPVTGDYSIHLALEAFHGGTWHGALDIYDSLHQADPNSEAFVSVGGGFYSILNQAPEADITVSPDPAVAEQEATLSANATDADGTVALIEWDTDNDGIYDNGTGETLTHSFPAKGDYVVGVRVTDDRGLAGTASATITVVRCDDGDLSGAVHDNVEPLAEVAGEGRTVHDVNCEIIGGLGY